MIPPLLFRLVVALIILSANACGGADEPLSKLGRLSEQSGMLSPGRHIVNEFEPALSLKVDKGWQVSEGLEEQFFEIVHDPLGGNYFVAISLNNPSEVSAPRSPHDLMPVPKDWVSWFQEHPYLETSSPQPATVGGVEGKRFNTRASAPEDFYSADCEGVGVPLWPLSGGHHWCADSGYTTQTIVLNDVQGEKVIIDVTSDSRPFEKALTRANDVLKTVEWEDA